MRLPRLRRNRRTFKRRVLWLPFTIQILLWLLLGVGVAVGAAWALWTLVGQPDLSGARGPVSTQEKFDGLKIALTVVGGIGGVIALTVAYRKQRLGEAAERREDTKVFTDRFTKASELLGSDRAAVRLSGVYAMAALADDWGSHRQTCIDVLCAYLRMPYTPSTGKVQHLSQPRQVTRRLGLRKPQHYRRPSAVAAPPPPRNAGDTRDEQQVRHTVIRVIAAHLRREAPTSWNGHHFDFTGATFDGGDFHQIVTDQGTVIEFRSARFYGGEVNFSEATFSGGIVDFRGATFSGGIVNFSEATFSGGIVNFSEATFSGGMVNFRGARFSGSEVDFGGATFSGGIVNFSEATFSGGIVNYMFATFSGSGVYFRVAAFSGGEVNFIFARFSGSEVNFGAARFSGGEVNFGRARFSGGTVDLSSSSVDGLPPNFDEWPHGTPQGLTLPSSSEIDPRQEPE